MNLGYLWVFLCVYNSESWGIVIVKIDGMEGRMS